MELHSVRHAAVLATLVLSAMLFGPSAVLAEPAAQSVPQDRERLPEVQVTGPKLDQHKLNRVAMKFVESHTSVSPMIRQVQRWRLTLCAQVSGLSPAAGAVVSRRVEEVARSVGARTRGVGKNCTANVEVVFTPEPQQFVDHIAQAFPMLLGSYRSRGDTNFSRAIQAWYLTGTRSVYGYQPPADASDYSLFFALFDPSQIGIAAMVDPAEDSGTQPPGVTGSFLTKGLTSELLHVLVVVDTGKVAKRSLPSIADYIAMLSLTRMGSLDACSELPSIIDLLSSGCGKRQRPSSLTGADTAYLQALYSMDIEANLNLAQADMRDRMIKTILRN